MDRIKHAAKATRDAFTAHSPFAGASGQLAVPHDGQHAAPDDSASTASVKSGIVGPRPGTAIHDFAPSGSEKAVDVNKPLPEPPIEDAADTAVPSVHQKPKTHVQRKPIPDRNSSLKRPNARPPAQPTRPSLSGGQSSIRIRRLPSSQTVKSATTQGPGNVAPMPTVMEEPSTQNLPSEDAVSTEARPGMLGRARRAVQSALGLRHGKDAGGEAASSAAPNQEYDSNMVDFLDTVDPEVATLTSLTNVQNSLFVPDLGRYINRRPTYTLRSYPSTMTRVPEVEKESEEQLEEKETGRPPTLRRAPSDTQTIATIDSRLSDSRYAVLPHGASLAGWSKEDKRELNDHVRHMLHSRRSRFKRALRGFGQYVRRPLGFLVTLYATLITLFGLAWVLFLIGWINVGGKQLYVVDVIDNVLVALFALVGDGLAPFRAVDTYHMIYIAHYHHLTWRLRSERRLPTLRDHNDLPSTTPPPDLEAQLSTRWDGGEFSVLTPAQQARLAHHASKFAKSHTFYKPHETETHFAFPLRLLVAVVVLLDCHSLFQMALGACTWGIDYRRRPFALTTVILCCSIACNATAGVLIMVGDRRTRKKDVLERMNRQELTEEAMGVIEERREREREEEEGEEAEMLKSGETPKLEDEAEHGKGL